MARTSEILNGLDKGVMNTSHKMSFNFSKEKEIPKGIFIPRNEVDESDLTTNQKLLWKRARRLFLASDAGQEFVHQYKKDLKYKARGKHTQAKNLQMQREIHSNDLFGGVEVQHDPNASASLDRYLDLETALAKIDSDPVKIEAVSKEIVFQFGRSDLWYSIFEGTNEQVSVDEEGESCSFDFDQYLTVLREEKEKIEMRNVQASPDATVRLISAVSRDCEIFDFSTPEEAKIFLKLEGFVQDPEKQRKYLNDFGETAILVVH